MPEFYFDGSGLLADFLYISAPDKRSQHIGKCKIFSSAFFVNNLGLLKLLYQFLSKIYIHSVSEEKENNSILYVALTNSNILL